MRIHDLSSLNLSMTSYPTVDAKCVFVFLQALGLHCIFDFFQKLIQFVILYLFLLSSVFCEVHAKYNFYEKKLCICFHITLNASAVMTCV